MNSLSRQIKALEADMECNQMQLRLNAELLQLKLKRTPTLLFSLLGSFGVGYWIGMKFDKAVVKEKMAQAPALFSHVVEHAKVLLPMILSRL